MTQPRPQALEQQRDVLYITDAELIRRLGVPERLAKPTILHLESKAGFPKKQALWGNRRYWPAVRAYLDRLNDLKL